MSQDYQKDQAEFLKVCDTKCHALSEVYNLITGYNPDTDGPIASLILGRNLIEEEVNRELLPKLNELQHLLIYKNAVLNFGNQEDYENHVLNVLTEILDGAVDSIYVILHTMNTLGFGPIFQQAWDEVQNANMTKAVEQEDGTYKVIKREGDGKILKPQGWIAPNVKDIIEKHLGTDNEYS